MGGELIHQNESDSDEDTVEEEDGYYEPLQDESITMIPEVNDALSSGRKEVRVGGATLTGITGHEWREGMLKLKAQWDHDDTTIEDLQDFKEYHPCMVATYITTHD